ncbi:MAG: YigZ family protein [Clostridiales bacterium]|jgi:uncharacterized YigZ family protein|nr:YigZ family protein [Clostridiales bacterium]
MPEGKRHNRLRGAGEYSFEEKRSRFIGYCEPAASEEAARAFIESVRSAHKTASHHVYAYQTPQGNNPAYTRHSDDGEPQGTAGLPVLNVFLKNEIIRFVCVAVRYFGGTLLGKGGLTRAYSKAAKGALESAGFEPIIEIKNYEVVCRYGQLAQLKYFLEKNGLLDGADMEYGENCRAVIAVPETKEEIFLQGVGLCSQSTVNI